MPLAIYDKMDDFTTHEVQLKEGDQLYMFSDGFVDQFGGINETVRQTGGKKFKYKQYRRLLLEGAHKPMLAQRDILNNAFEKWKGSLDQIDDVVVVGIKV
jgi:serine phosphatase RsbU (regulator of sigma subunit)